MACSEPMRMTLLNDDRVYTNFAFMSSEDISEFAVMIPSSRFYARAKKLYLATLNDMLVVTLREDESIEKGQLALNAESSNFLGISAGDEVNINVFVPPSKGLDLSLLRIEVNEVELLDGSSTHQPDLASDLVREFVKTFNKQIFTEFQSILLRYGGNIYHCTVADASLAVEKNSPSPKRGMLRKSTEVIVEVSSSMSGQIIGAEIIKSLFRDGFDMNSLEQELISLNIGGMTSQIREIIRLAFGSRMESPATAKRLNLKHKKGMLLYGPPGSGKTLIARRICKLLNAKEPLIVHGPEITQELYGASERQIRALFEDAEKDEKQYGSKSDLHVIIFDEIDSIGKKRGAAAGSFHHDDKIVNQLLTKIDGPTELNNIFIIATTNRKDLLDEALLRDGRIELHIKIDYPDMQGRKQILDVCTKKWKQAHLLDIDVDLQEIAHWTNGYSGAALASLVTLSHTYANEELVDLDPMRPVKKNVKLTMDHFRRAFEHGRLKLQESNQLRVEEEQTLSSTDIPEFLKVDLSSYEEDKAKFEKKIKTVEDALFSYEEDNAKFERKFEKLLKEDKAEFEMKIVKIESLLKRTLSSYKEHNAKFEMKIEAHLQAALASFDKDKAKLEEKIEALGQLSNALSRNLGS